MSTIKVNSIEPANAGSEDYFLARAWVNFDGTGTVAIRSDGNVSSITDLAVGNYTANFSNSFSDANYCWTMGGGLSNSGTNWNEFHWVIRNAGSGTPTYPPSTSSVTVTHAHSNTNNNYKDSSYGLIDVIK